MSEKIKIVVVNVFLIGIILFVFTALLNTHYHHQRELNDAMQVFPSYDWGEEDNTVMAYLSANTHGSNRDKQQSIIECLDYMWKYNCSAEDYANYIEIQFYEEPTAKDYELIRLVIQHTWADD